MDHDRLIALMQEALPGAQIERASSLDAHPTFYVQRGDLPTVVRALYDNEARGLGFTCLAEMTAIDFWPHEPRFEVVYILVSIARRQRLRMKVRLHGTDAHVPTVSAVWPAANWLEREIWDLFGIAFDGHPDPRRLLMPEDWEGHPLRKDYPVQIRKTPRATEPLQVTEEEFRASVARDRLARE